MILFMKLIEMLLCTTNFSKFIIFTKLEKIVTKKNKKNQVVDQYDKSQEVRVMNRKRSVTRPEVTNMDDIALLIDEDLVTRISSLEEGRNKAVSSGQDPYYWEVELAYFRREYSLRKTRKDIHEKWMVEQIRMLNVDESNLPYADFDNLKYVMVNLYEKTRNKRHCF